jgi:hypothetical protein
MAALLPAIAASANRVSPGAAGAAERVVAMINPARMLFVTIFVTPQALRQLHVHGSGAVSYRLLFNAQLMQHGQQQIRGRGFVLASDMQISFETASGMSR